MHMKKFLSKCMIMHTHKTFYRCALFLYSTKTYFRIVHSSVTVELRHIKIYFANILAAFFVSKQLHGCTFFPYRYSRYERGSLQRYIQQSFAYKRRSPLTLASSLLLVLSIYTISVFLSDDCSSTAFSDTGSCKIVRVNQD